MQVYDETEDERTDYIPGPNGALARIKRKAGTDSVTFIHADHLGTARAGTSATGALAFEDFHTPFGESLLHPDATDDQGDYTGHIRDRQTGLSYMQARYQDPLIGRFLSIDPMTFMDTGNPAMFNRYAYTFNDPINMLDPDGEHPAIAGYVAGALHVVKTKAKIGFVKGSAGGILVSGAVQKVSGESSLVATGVSGLKGGLVGAVQEVTGSTGATSLTAAVVGFVDGAVTDAVTNENRSIGSAIENGVKVGGADATFAAAGAKYGDAVGAGIAMSFAATSEHAPGSLDTVAGLAGDLLKSAGDLGSNTADRARELLGEDQFQEDPFDR